MECYRRLKVTVTFGSAQLSRLMACLSTLNFTVPRHRDVPGRGRGEEAPVAQIQEFDAVVRGKHDSCRDSCRAADRPAVLIQGRSEERVRRVRRKAREEDENKGVTRQQERKSDDAALRRSDVCDKSEERDKRTPRGP